jgi:hypothetical protein
MITQIDLSLKDIAASLLRIANALEEQNKPKGLGNPYAKYGIAPLNCYSKDELPLPTANNSVVTASHDGDILYKSPENPNWYNISDPNFTNKNIK